MTARRDDPSPALTHAPVPTLRVLASGSRGNCSLLSAPVGPTTRHWLIDAGVGIRRMTVLLRELGMSFDDLSGVLLTHLDHDHISPPVIGALPEHAPLHLHKRHLRRGDREGLLYHRTLPFDEPFELAPGVSVAPALAAHDELGSSTLRISFAGHGTLGFATDLGCVPTSIVNHLAGVDVLAIESNHCPHLQERSSRPQFLKRRIMGGAGHLNNQQCAQAVRDIAPREHVVLLHLSQDCNTPELAAHEHRNAAYELTIASQDEPARPVAVRAARATAVVPAISGVQLSMF
ncbi:MAG: MBL fold metallo-hydrolase [Planctomycetota bacterium]|nr:MBL fold metallo-hydrolase [Planctomycetota bacterium]